MFGGEFWLVGVCVVCFVCVGFGLVCCFGWVCFLLLWLVVGGVGFFCLLVLLLSLFGRGVLVVFVLCWFWGGFGVLGGCVGCWCVFG